MKQARALKAMIGALISGLAVGATPEVLAQTVKIGFINSYSGFLAQPGERDGQRRDALQAGARQGPAGRASPSPSSKRDDTSTPETAKRLAQELITRDHVQLLFGLIASPNAAAIAPLTAKAKIPLVITNAAGASITRISPYVVRVSFTLWHSALPMGQWAVKQGWKTAFTAVSDFIPGHDADDAFNKGLTDAGGKILGSIAFSPAIPISRRSCSASATPSPMSLSSGSRPGTQATAMMKSIAGSRRAPSGHQCRLDAGPRARRGIADYRQRRSA